MSGQPEQAATRLWYVQAAGKTWGPYPEHRIEDFLAEGRISAETLVAGEAEGPFVAAGRQARLHRLFGDAAIGVEAEPLETPAAAPAPARALLVWAALKSQAPDRLEAGLAVHGPLVRVGPGLWLVRSRLGAAGLRNDLTRRLDAADMLMVVEAPLADAAWFNLEGEADRLVRQLWGQG